MMLPCPVGSLLVTEPLVWGDMLGNNSTFYTKVVAESEISTVQVVPAAGCIVCLLLWLSPAARVLQARREKSLGDLQPYTFPIIVANCAGWVAYAYIQCDIFVWLANEPGLLLGIFFTFTTYGLTTDERARNVILALLVFFAALLTMGIVTASGALDNHAIQLLWGFTTNGILLMFYGAPLASMVKVVRTRCSGPLVWQLSLMSILNGSLWVAYGLHQGLPFVWVPNAAGALLGNLQLTLCLAFPRQRAAVLDVSGLAQPLLVEGGVADVEHEVAALSKVRVAARGATIQVHAHLDGQAAGWRISVPRDQDGEIQDDLN